MKKYPKIGIRPTIDGRRVAFAKALKRKKQ